MSQDYKMYQPISEERKQLPTWKKVLAAFLILFFVSMPIWLTPTVTFFFYDKGMFYTSVAFFMAVSVIFMTIAYWLLRPKK